MTDPASSAETHSEGTGGHLPHPNPVSENNSTGLPDAKPASAETVSEYLELPPEASDVDAGSSVNTFDSTHTADTQTADREPLAVDVQDLWVRYGKTVAVRGIHLQIPQGEVFGFIGPNGAGKSSSIKVLATLISTYEGIARVCGYDIRQDPMAVRERIGYVPDFFGVYEDLSAREYLHFFAAAYRIDRHKRDNVVCDVLELTDLTSKVDAQVDTLSRGMKQRLSLARVLLHDPDLLLLDEPTSGLDPRARIEVRELLKALTEMGKTILISSHILHELAHLCTRIGIIEAGEMVTQGSLTDIYRQLSLMRIIHLQLTDATPELLEEIRKIPGVEQVEEQVDRISLQLREDV
ncbi:MAG: ABC transporter ATP-binding protein, partial [Planctomycetaceae bacterium]